MLCVRIRQVRLVRKEEHRQLLAADVLVLQEHFKLILGHCEAQVVCSVHHKDDGLALGVVVLPESAVLPLPRHVEHCEVNFVFLKRFYLETHSGCQLLLLVLLRLQEVDHCRLA